MRLSVLGSLAERCRLDAIGAAPAEEFTGLRSFLEERAANGCYPPPFAKGNLSDRLNPRSLLPEAKSIIVAGVSHHSDRQLSECPNHLTGFIAASLRGRDYHRVLQERLECLCGELTAACPASFAVQVDNGPIIEREAAVRAGLGQYGRNSSLINPTFGSWLSLGLIITDIPFEDAATHGRHDICGECRICVNACPSKALTPQGLNPYRCLSYISQTKGAVPKEFRSLLGRRLFGCDTCQEVCPQNRDAKLSTDPETSPESEEAAYPSLFDIVAMDTAQFRTKYGPTGAGWRGRTVLQRNAVYAMGNSKDKRLVPVLARLLSKDERPVIRGAAAWTLGQIEGDAARRTLLNALRVENDNDVRKEIKEALASFR